jgi:hypothetical protein
MHQHLLLVCSFRAVVSESVSLACSCSGLHRVTLAFSFLLAPTYADSLAHLSIYLLVCILKHMSIYLSTYTQLICLHTPCLPRPSGCISLHVSATYPYIYLPAVFYLYPIYLYPIYLHILHLYFALSLLSLLFCFSFVFLINYFLI